MIPSRKILSCILVPAFCASPQLLLAQGGANAPAAGLEEIVVTARKREQSLQDLSVSVMALPESLLKDAFLTDSEDLTQLVPSLNMQRGTSPRSSSFNIRGVGTQSYSDGVEPSVSTVLDGVVMGRSGMAFMQLLDVERVEVLRGPQGTLFGKNSTAGVVHIITQEPSVDFTASASVTAIEDDQLQGGFTISGPAGDALGYRLSGFYAEDDGYIDNVFNGDKLNQKEDWSLRGKLRWDATDQLSFLWASDLSNTEGDCCVTTFREINPWPAEPPNNQARVDRFLDNISPAVPSEDNTDANHDYPDRLELDGQGHSLTMDWQLGDFTLTSITAYREWDQKSSSDTDQQPEHLLNVWDGSDSEQEQWTQELRLSSPMDRTISYVAGLYYFDQQINRSFERYLLSGTSVSTYQVDTLNYAAFGEATWNISDDWRVILGARYTEDDLEFDFERTSETLLAPPIPYFTDQTDADDLSGKLAAEWNTTDEILLYASIVQGYKGPAYNLTSGSTPENTQPVDPETSESFELGMKSTWLDNRLMLNVSLFHTEYDDFQAEATESVPVFDEDGNPTDIDGNGIPDSNFSFILTNVGKVTTKGVEIDLMAQPTPNLSLFGGVAFIDAGIDSYDAGPCSFGQEFRGVGYKGQTGCGENPAQQDLSGGELPFSPDWKLTLSANYVISLESMPFDMILKGSYRAQDDVQFSIDQDHYQRQDSYQILDLSVMLSDKDERYTAALFVKNALDENYVSAVGAQNENIAPNAYVQYLPRTFERRVGVELRYNWF